MTAPPQQQFIGDSAPVKRPFVPTESSAQQSMGPPAARALSRVDSRGSHRLAAAPPEEIAASLSSVGMRAREAVGRGFASRNNGPTGANVNGAAAHEATSSSLDNSTRSVLERTYSMPISSRDHELKPFASFGTDLAPFVPTRKRRAEDGSDAAVNFNALSPGGAGDATADDVLGGFMSEDDDADSSIDGADDPLGAPSPLVATNDPTEPARTLGGLPKRTFKQAQTMPVSGRQASRFPSGSRAKDDMDTEDDGDQRYREIKFSEYANKSDF